MSIIPGILPRRYHARLDLVHDRLKTFPSDIGDFYSASVDPLNLLFPHTVWFLVLAELLKGNIWSRVARRGAWAYYLADSKGQMVCVQLQITRGKKESISLSKGPLVDSAVRLVRRASVDKRCSGLNLEYRLLIAPVLQLAFVWLRGQEGFEVFIPATRGKGPLQYGKWFSRKEVRQGMLDSAERHLAAQRRMKELLQARGDKDLVEVINDSPG